MTTLSPRARRRDHEIELAIHEGNARHVLELVDAWGLPRDERALVPEDDDVRLHFHGLEHAEDSTIADVWHR